MPETYASAGVDYAQLDALKRFAQMAAAATEDNLPQGMSFVGESRGESAALIDVGPFYLATVEEGLGTKNRIAETLANDETTHFAGIGQDTVAMIVNDLLVVGARPLTVNAHWALGSSQLLSRFPHLGEELADGWAKACNVAGAVFAGGETPMLAGIIYPETMGLSGSAVGIIDPKSRLTLGDTLQAGDHIILIESSGIHANGISLVRKLVDDKTMPDGYDTRLPDGRRFGDAILSPTHIYARLQQAVLDAADIHYMVHVTGHGWRKFMRADRDFTYRFHTLPPVPDEFRCIARFADMNAGGMYETFNMGTGFAFMVPPEHARTVSETAAAFGLKSWDAGVVEDGKKQVVLEPAGVIYSKESLQIR